VNEPVVLKEFADSFEKMTPEETLAKLGVTELLISGMMTQNCVTHTAISKAAEKYGATILPDCCTTVDEMIDLMQLALQTDSTRFITFALNGLNAVPVIPGVTSDWHNLSHHGHDPAKLAELKVPEIQQMKLFGELLTKLKRTREEGGTLLDRTIVMFGSNLGNASSHDNKYMPILAAGGGFEHGQHLAFDPQKNPPLSNLYVQFLRRLGADANALGSSNGTIPGFVMARA